MGSSGAGKTTLLDVLARRKNVGVISGDLLVGGAKLGSDFQRATGYAEQQDTHEPTSTVREAFRFSAYLRQSPSVTTAEKNAYVEQVIALLELEEFADSIIGFPGFGLGIEARKRVTIGVELSAKPELLLFLLVLLAVPFRDAPDAVPPVATNRPLDSMDNPHSTSFDSFESSPTLDNRFSSPSISPTRFSSSHSIDSSCSRRVVERCTLATSGRTLRFCGSTSLRKELNVLRT